MYDRIQAAFAQGKAFIPFLTCGDPDLETTAATVRAMAANGADLIELGIPFSDPTAEGPVIQEANLRALRGGVTTDQVFALVQDLRRDVTVPLVFMTYANVVFTYGAEAFFARCQSVGVDGIILPDLPYEEKGEFQAACRKHGVALISMIAPHLRRPHCQDCPGGGGVPLPGLQPGGYRGAAGHHHRPGRHPPGDPREYGPALCHRLWHRHPRPGPADGRAGGRGHCRLGHCEEDGGPRAGAPADVGAYVKAMKAAVGQGAPQGKA